MRKKTGFGFLVTLLSGLLLAAPTWAHPRGPGVPYTVSVEDEWGRSLETFHLGDETFVLGTQGARYRIRVRNQTGRRVEAVVSVDGRDAISGEPGDFVHQRGYVLGPYESVAIEGFRQSLEQVASFRFGSPAGSYSARMGTPENVGVIGVAFFPERRIAPPPRIARPRASAPSRGPGHRRTHPAERSAAGAPAAEASSRDAAPRAGLSDLDGPGDDGLQHEREEASASGAYPGAPRRNNLGTEYGESRQSRVREVAFRRDSSGRPAQLVALRYDDEEGLVARGIRVHPGHAVAHHDPEPFPVNRFAPPPP